MRRVSFRHLYVPGELFHLCKKRPALLIELAQDQLFVPETEFGSFQTHRHLSLAKCLNKGLSFEEQLDTRLTAVSVKRGYCKPDELLQRSFRSSSAPRLR